MDNALKLLVFILDEHYYGIPLPSIIKILPSVEITPIPLSSDYILGVVNVHGDVIPALNIRKLLGLNQKAVSLFDYFVITEIYSKKIIFIVDSVQTITEYFTKELTSVDKFFSIKMDHVEGILKKNENLIFLLNIEKIISENDIQSLEKISKIGGTIK